MGLGHLYPIRALAQYFIDQHFSVYIASRELTHCDNIFKDMPVRFLQAPHSKTEHGDAQPDLHIFSQILGRNGYHEKSELMGLCHAWQALFDLIEPDLIIAEHSPTVLLAARDESFSVLHIGTGFTVPPKSQPLAPYIPIQDKNHLDAIMTYEDHIKQNCNYVLRKQGKPALSQLCELYSDVTHEALLTLPELDHFAHLRKQGIYLGLTDNTQKGQEPIWPKVGKKKVFVYLKPFEKLETLLIALKNSDASVIFYSNDIGPKYLEQFRSANIRFEYQPLDLHRIAEQADIAITNGNHSTLAHFLRNRVGLVLLPLHWEQKLMADRLNRQGIGLVINKHSEQSITEVLKQCLDKNTYTLSQHAIAKKYQPFNDSNAQKTFFQKLIKGL